MKSNTCFQDFLKYASLNVAGMLGLSCYILADTFFVSKALGANGLTALNLAIPVYSFINGSGLMIGMGGATKFSIARGQGKDQRVNQIFSTAVFLTAVLAGIFFLIGIFAAGPLIRLLGADDTIYGMGKTYLQVLLLFAPLFMTNNLLLCFIRNDKAPQLAMAAMITGSLSNVVLDYLFMFPLGMGIFGAAFATGLAPAISISILSPFLLKKRNHFHLQKCRIVLQEIWGILSCGIPSLITEVSSGIVIIIFNILILGLAGNIGVAAYGVVALLLVTSEHIGHQIVTGKIVGRDLLKDPGLHRSLFADFFSTTLSGLVGSVPTTTYGENIGVMAVTKVYSVQVIGGAAVLSICCSFLGKLAALINTIPGPVIGGISFLLYGMIGTSGLRMLVDGQVDYGKSRNLTLTSVVFVVGLSGIALHLGDVELTGMVLACVVAMILSLVFYVLDRQKLTNDQEE